MFVFVFVFVDNKRWYEKVFEKNESIFCKCIEILNKI